MVRHVCCMFPPLHSRSVYELEAFVEQPPWISATCKPDNPACGKYWTHMLPEPKIASTIEIMTMNIKQFRTFSADVASLSPQHPWSRPMVGLDCNTPHPQLTHTRRVDLLRVLL